MRNEYQTRYEDSQIKFRSRLHKLTDTPKTPRQMWSFFEEGFRVISNPKTLVFETSKDYDAVSKNGIGRRAWPLLELIHSSLTMTSPNRGILDSRSRFRSRQIPGTIASYAPSIKPRFTPPHMPRSSSKGHAPVFLSAGKWE
ncbi:uncharacterized protein RSE6_01127 [Rhynchosporium secalis]|uniref:Uncharacterized protein n=1 Tax=Rhynchosporium secalis TaxID=38038 RepID=A0A1E1LWZ0_RHYSE|nr:uncharacterized protein RSE6_01127 [Rhynchosporium secalis]